MTRMTQLSTRPPARPAPAPLCRDQILSLLLEGAGLTEIRLEALIDRLALHEPLGRLTARGRQ
jgi:hypothetical protein